MRIAMIGWEFPPFTAGGLGVHCYELTKALANENVKIDFYMPAVKGKHVKHEWLNIIQVDAGFLSKLSEQELKALEEKLKRHGKAPSFNSYYSAMQEVTFKGGNAKAVAAQRLEEFEKSGKLEAADTYGEDFFKAVYEFNLLCAAAVIINNKKANYSLIHNHDWITSSAAIEAKSKLKIPLVTTMHSTEYDRTANLWPSPQIISQEKKVLEAADKVIAVSNYTKNVLISKFKVEEEKILPVYNGIDFEKFSKRKARKIIGDEARVVLFHGRLSIQKGAEFFLKAAKKVLEREDDVRFVVSGSGDMQNRLVNLSISLGIAGKVTFIGYMPQEKLLELYSSCDAYVMPSVSEPFGITALEAMACQVPTIISKTSGVSEVTSHCLKVDFWDEYEMANKLLAILKYKSLSKTIAPQLKDEARQMTWEKAAIETKKVYSTAVKGSNANSKTVENQLKTAEHCPEMHLHSP